MTLTRTLPLALAAAALIALTPLRASAEDGTWLNLYDGESTFGWTNLGTAKWEVVEGVLTCTDSVGSWLATTSQFKDFELTAALKVSSPGTAGLLVRSPLTGHYSENGAGAIIIGGQEHAGEWQEIKVTALGSTVTASINGAEQAIECKNEIGHIGILYHNYHQYRKSPTLEVKDVKLRPLNLNPIFNGTDLTGWNILPDHASEFNVVDGAIRITNGNGQIETDALYKNFLFQVDIFSNGEHLNSDVFVRGPKGVFWKGLEMQVRNQWMRDDRTRAVDFGSGGLYGVQPARKVVSNDGEWFNETIIANGNHFATWVNGYQVTDYFDMRPVHPEGDGKNGYVNQAGTIHLQGHDPTTDLSFKNILLQQYPE